jgi:hypothetical protein
MGSKAQAKKSSETAKQMKIKGIRRTHTICPICYKKVSLPFPGNHKH